jgi:nicotinate-nucleotide--dimethylbenzimidazole phosphoribosyltransferase
VANQALAEACDAVVLVVAGQPTWIKRPPPGKTLPAQVLQEPTQTLPALSTGMVIQPGMDLPMPDEGAAAQARNRLRRLDLPGAGFGALAATVAFAAATQGNPIPAAWQAVRVLLLHGDHEGAASAGDAPAEAERRAREARAGDGVLAALAAESKATVQVVDVPAGRPLDIEDALTADEVDQALAYGWRLAEDAADAGVEVLVLGACGAGTETAAAAVTSAITGTEVVALLARVTAPDGRFDDGAWIARCAAIRDGLQRTRSRPRSAHDLLAALGGGDIAVATGILLGAASRRTPVLLDGPVGVAAALASRDIGGQARHWCLLPDDGGHPTVRHAAGVLDLVPVLDLRLGLGEGATALAALPLLRAMIGIAGTLPIHPALREDGPDTAPELGD